MEFLQDLHKQVTNMIWSDYLDIILVAIVFYNVQKMIRTSAAARIAKVVLAVVLISWATEEAELHALNFLISQVLAVGLIALVILFQPELRRMMDHLGGVSLKKLINPEKAGEEVDYVVSQTVLACEAMSREKIGALMVFERHQPLDDYMKTGTIVDGLASEQLIRNIFFPKAALHDGAMMIRDGRIQAAGCVLPLSESNRLSADLGTRHRAGVGMSENSDAVVVIVSEETGTISVAVGGILKRHLAARTLEKLLHNELCPTEEEQKEQDIRKRLKNKLTGKEKDVYEK